MTLSQEAWSEELYENYVKSLEQEFPGFSISGKRALWHQQFIHWALVLITLGGQREYLTRYTTVLFGRVFVPDSWKTRSAIDRYLVLRHEAIHLRQGLRYGALGMSLRYVFPYFPLGLAIGRARIEWEAYQETLRATAEVLGYDAAADPKLREYLVKQFTGPAYGWMWPFPKTIHRWIDQELEKIRSMSEAPKLSAKASTQTKNSND